MDTMSARNRARNSADPSTSRYRARPGPGASGLGLAGGSLTGAGEVTDRGWPAASINARDSALAESQPPGDGAMSVTLVFGPDDPARTRFVISPAWETMHAI